MKKQQTTRSVPCDPILSAAIEGLIEARSMIENEIPQVGQEELGNNIPYDTDEFRKIFRNAALPVFRCLNSDNFRKTLTAARNGHQEKCDQGNEKQGDWSDPPAMFVL